MEFISHRLEIEKITGMADSAHISAVFSRRVTLADGGVGTMISCILLSGSSDSEAQAIVSNLFELAANKLEGSGDSILAVLEGAGDACREYVSGKKLALSFGHVFFYKDVCYIVKHGEGVKLWVFEPPKSVEITFESGSGPVAPGQIYVLATLKFFKIVETSVFSQKMEIALAETIDGLATKISDHEDQAEIGAAFVYVKEENEQVLLESDEKVDRGEKAQEQVPASDSKFKNPLSILQVLIAEIKKLRQGDIRAVFRLRRRIVIGALAVFLILAVSVGLTLGQKNERKKVTQFNVQMAGANAKYQEGLGLVELNRSRAREVLIEAENEVNSALMLIANDEDARKLLSDIKSRLAETEVSEDLSLKTLKEFEEPLVGLSLRDKNLVVTSQGKVFEIDATDSIEHEISAAVGDARRSFVYDGKVFILTSGKVYALDLASGKLAELVSATGTFDIAVFLGNIYLLSEGQIAKFVPIADGYSQPQDYLSGEEVFSDKSRMAIDGSVWVTSGNRQSLSSNKIFKFVRGERENFEISGLVANVGELSQIYTDTDSDKLYVVDSTNSALLVVGKDGILQGTYQSAEFGRAADIVVDEAAGKIYLAVGSKVLEATLE